MNKVFFCLQQNGSCFKNDLGIYLISKVMKMDLREIERGEGYGQD
jgi:hypothetical protein